MLDKHYLKQLITQDDGYKACEDYLMAYGHFRDLDDTLYHDDIIILLDFYKEQGRIRECFNWLQCFFPAPRQGNMALYGCDLLLHLNEYEQANTEISSLIDTSLYHNDVAFYYCLLRIAVGLSNIQDLEKYCDILRQLDPKFSKSYDWLACIYRQQHRFGEAEALLQYVRQHAILPEHYINHQYALNYLDQGYYQEAFMLYGNDSVHALQKIISTSKASLWKGQALHQESLTIMCVYGLGDLFFFLRYLPQAIKQARSNNANAHIIALCWKSTLSILESLHIFDGLYAMDDEVQYPITDYIIPLFQLPSVLKVQRWDVGLDTPYVTIPSTYADTWQAKIRRNKKIKIGLCYEARVTERSIPKHLLHCLWSNATITAHYDFYILVKDSNYLAHAPIYMHDYVIDYSSEFNDLWDVAALIDQMDIVISVDTLQANIAGALNKKSYILTHYFSEFRWHKHGDHAAFYPSCVLYNMGEQESWGDLLQKIIQQLHDAL